MEFKMAARLFLFRLSLFPILIYQYSLDMQNLFESLRAGAPGPGRFWLDFLRLMV
jgi:hypothetical protein